MVAAGWQFWIDRGGTFTDVVARRPDGSPVATPFPTQDSSMLVPLAAADCLVVRAPHAPAARAGERCDFIQLDD